MKLTTLFLEPEARAIDLDGDARFAAHATVLKRKQILSDVFAEMNQLFLDCEQRYLTGDGLRIELGAGVAPLRASDPEIKSTDVVAAPHLDMVVDAQQMQFADGSVKALFGQNCFHHFPEPRRFFREAARVIAPGGGILLIEPFYGPVAAALFKRMFATETFDKNAPNWEVPANGPMVGANQALSYIVFVRDREVFEREFPELELVELRPLSSYARYLLSGGLNFRQLIPDFAAPVLRAGEPLLAPLNPLLALHHLIVLRRRPAR